MLKSELNSRNDPPLLTSVDSKNERAFTADNTDNATLSPWDYWQIFRRYRWSVLGVGFIAAIFGLLSALSATSLYKAQTRLLIKVSIPNITAMQQFEPMPAHWMFFETQSDIIESRAVAERVIADLGLQVPPLADESNNADTSGGGGWSIAMWLGGLFSELKAWVPDELRFPEPKPLDAEGRYAALVDSVLSGLSVSGGQDSEVLIVKYVSADPRKAAQLSNAFAEAYIEFELASRTNSVHQTSSWLGTRIQELRKKMVASEDALREFQAREDLVDTENREKIISAKLGTLTSELIRAESEHNDAKASYQQMRSLMSRHGGYEAVASVASDQSVVDANRNKKLLEQRVSELSERYGEKHPKMIGARADLKDAERRLKIEVQKAVNSARKQLDLAASQESKLREMIERQQSEMRSVSGKVFKLRQLEREVDVNRNLYETFLARFKESDIASEYDVPNARIIDRAMVPTSPFKPNRERIVFISILIGLFVGMLLAVLRDRLDNTFKTKEDIEEKLKLPVIGILPRIKANPPNRYVVERQALKEPRSAFSESVNDVRTSILFSHIDEPSKVILITSSVPGEGKTTLASNLALTFCRRGKTLLIDGDLRKGRLRNVLGLDSRIGLTNMLSEECSPDEAIARDPEAENLFILTSGSLPPNPLEVISSMRFTEHLAKLREMFDYVVIDGTPLLPVSDSIVLARTADAVVLTIKADDTSYDIARESLNKLLAAKVRPVGIALQQVDMRKIRSYESRYLTSYRGYYRYRKS